MDRCACKKSSKIIKVIAPNRAFILGTKEHTALGGVNMASITKVNKSYKAVVSYYEQGKRHRLSKSFKRKSDAQLWAADKEDRKNKGDVLIYSDEPVDKFFDNFVKTYKDGKVAPNTLRAYERVSKKIKQAWANRAIDSITYLDYQNFLNSEAKNQRASSVKRTHRIVRLVMSKAVQFHKIRENFTDGAVISGGASQKASQKYLEDADIKKLVSYTATRLTENSDVFNCMILTSLLTGLRYQEICGLTWDCVDLNKQTLKVAKNYDPRFQQFHITKTSSSVRTINFNGLLKNSLQKWRLIDQKYQLSRRFPNSDNFVFYTKRLTPPNESGTNYILKKLCRDLKLSKVITFHGLRHSHAAYLLSHGVSIQYVSKRLGHKNIAITMDTYAHLLKSAEEVEEKQAQQLLDQL